ncbi:hypothetical protein ACROYT_G035819 [Oculina patagonica]
MSEMSNMTLNKSDDHQNADDLATHETIVIINCILNAPLILMAIFGNALVLAAIIRTPSIRSTSMIMLCSLAVSDFLVGLITQPLYIVKELTENRVLDILWDTLAYSFCGVSLLIITADDNNMTNHSSEGKGNLDYGSNFEDHASIDAPVIINCVLNAPLMLISILGNALILATIKRTPSIRSNSMIMLSSLAASDLLVGVIAQPLFIFKELAEKSNKDSGNMMNHTDNGKNETAYHSNFEEHNSNEAIAIINCGLSAPLMLISILGNALVLAAIIRTPSIHSNLMMMLCSLAVSDLLVGVIAQPLFIIKDFTDENNVFVVNLSKITVLSLCGVSLGTITAITLDRFMALHYHMRYASLVTKSRVSRPPCQFAKCEKCKLVVYCSHLNCQEHLTMSDLLFTRHDEGSTRNQTFEGNHETLFQDYTGIDAILIIICVLNAPLMVISILGNALVLAAIIRTPSIRSNSMIMLSSLAVSDLLVGVIAQPLFIANKITNNCNVFVSNLAFMTGYSLCGVSLATITAISWDRFMALHYHMRYATLVTKSRTQLIVLMVWVTIFVSPSFNLWNERAFTF